MRYLYILICCFSFTGVATAEYEYDWATGNSYNTYNSGSSTQINGYNYGTGTSWSTTIDNNSGDMRGYDKNGNYWNYDESTGSYYNYGTGKTCFGKGSTRYCSD